MILDQCPHCGTKHIAMEDRFSEVFTTTTNESWKLVRCNNPNCRKLVLVVDRGGMMATYPGGSWELANDAPIPQEVRSDYQEAGKCLDAGCNKASLVMSRRALQRCLKEQGCTSHKLVDAINEAIEKNVLRKAFHPLAEEIRQYGNLGAHPDDDQLANASHESASKVLGFVGLLIHEFYEVPASAATLRAKRQGSGQP